MNFIWCRPLRYVAALAVGQEVLVVGYVGYDGVDGVRGVRESSHGGQDLRWRGRSLVLRKGWGGRFAVGGGAGEDACSGAPMGERIARMPLWI